MKRPGLIALAALAASMTLAPGAAHGATKYRYWQDLSVSGPYSGRITLAIAYEDQDRNGRADPRSAAAYDLRITTSCEPSGGLRQLGGNSASKYSPFNPKLISGRFDYRFESAAEQPQNSNVRGSLNGTVRKKTAKRKARVTGSFSIDDWDLSPSLQGCVSSGTYSATQCKRWRSKRNRPRWWREWKAPVCKDDAW